MARGKLHKVAELWVKGLRVDWQRLYDPAEPRPRRVSLPPYPFAREHYWVPVPEAAQSSPCA